jgi:hypothetical protein
MIRHVVLFRWKPEATNEQKQLVAAELRRLPPLVASIQSLEIGVDAGLNEGNADFAVTADFDDEAGYRAYVDHPAHRAVVAKYIAPIVADRLAAQFEF